MSHSAIGNDHAHGYTCDGQEHSIVKVRKAHTCNGGRMSRASPSRGVYSPDCTGIIEPGSIALTTILELFRSDTYACVPCALSIGALVAGETTGKSLDKPGSA